MKKEWIDKTVENKGIKTDSQHSAPINIIDTTISSSKTAPIETVTTVPTKTKTTNWNKISSWSVQNFQGLIDNKRFFDIGYDTDGEIGPFSDVILQEGH